MRGPALTTIQPRDAEDVMRGHLASALALLAAYARGENDDHSYAWDALRVVAGSVYGVTAPSWDANADLPASIHPTSAILVVILAALCRARIARGLPVTYRQLGCLAGVTGKTVMQLAGRGELRPEGGAVSAKEAKRWLKTREIEGFLDGENN